MFQQIIILRMSPLRTRARSESISEIRRIIKESVVETMSRAASIPVTLKHDNVFLFKINKFF